MPQHTMYLQHRAYILSQYLRITTNITIKMTNEINVVFYIFLILTASKFIDTLASPSFLYQESKTCKHETHRPYITLARPILHSELIARAQDVPFFRPKILALRRLPHNKFTAFALIGSKALNSHHQHTRFKSL